MAMGSPLLARVLRRPSYPYEKDGKLYVPSRKELFQEFFRRLNFVQNRKNWLGFFCWAVALVQIIPLAFFFARYFSLPLVFVGFVYSMIVLGTHGTIYYHRYSTHRAYRFSNPFWRFIVRNMVIKVIPEELYVVSHHVHHWISEQPGDPYNVHAGWLYCFLADAIHQPIAIDLSEEDYRRTAHLIGHCGVRSNGYAQYQKWGSICHPGYTFLHFALNWAFWFGVFYAIGGMPLATVMFGAAGVWGIGVRTFNYEGHGAGKDKRRDGIDFNRKDMSINQCWPGLVTGEWHNNHHLFPTGARAGFLPYQLDPAWWLIRFGASIGAVSSFQDHTEEFMRRYYLPYQNGLAAPSGAQAPG